jgi:uncharacterized membrane protein YhaH (DUF805 family)
MSRLLLSFRGRISRSTFWLAILSLGLTFVVLLILIEKIFGRASSLALYPPFFGPSPLWSPSGCETEANLQSGSRLP